MFLKYSGIDGRRLDTNVLDDPGRPFWHPNILGVSTGDCTNLESQ